MTPLSPEGYSPTRAKVSRAPRVGEALAFQNVVVVVVGQFPTLVHDQVRVAPSRPARPGGPHRQLTQTDAASTVRGDTAVNPFLHAANGEA